MDTSIDFNVNPVVKNHPTLQPTSRIERVLLLCIASLGILGSVYLFSLNTLRGSTPPEISSVLMLDSEDDDANSWTGKFNDFVKISGNKKVDEYITFSLLIEKEEGARYVMEMGDENRMIITKDIFPYSYKNPGKYTLELKKIKNGLISTLATKKIKIKK